MAVDGSRLRQELLDRFRRGVEAPLDDASFGALAQRVFAWQFETNATYRAYCLRRRISPADLDHWSRIPAVPTAAFKTVPLVSGTAAPDPVGRVFRTSGTTVGRQRRGEHHVPDLALYDAALEPTFRSFVLPDGARPRMLSLMPRSADLPDSSLAYMITRLVERLGGDGSGFYADVDGGIDDAALGEALRRAGEAEEPVALLGTSLAFLHWLDRLKGRGRRLRLPAGSRIMDTGGYKGSDTRVPEAELRARYRDWLGVAPDHCVNEYGMTELCSQCYDTTLRDRTRGEAPGVPGRKAGPPWLRSRVVHPETLEPVEPGGPGILQHFDLANLGSVMAVQTEDLAREVVGGYVLLGRAAGAPPRGCSIAMDLLLRALDRREGA